VGAKTAHEVNEHGRTRDAIDVVVTQDGDTLAFGGGEYETFGSFAQAADRERIGDVGELGAEMTLRLGLVRKGTGENSGQGFGNPQRSRDSSGKPGVRGPVRPGGHVRGNP
jgi:hypothetical protein